LEHITEYPDGRKVYAYYKAEYVPRCLDTICLGRLTKAFPSEKEAAEVWNRRVSCD
jgi:hypothetical protein